MMEKKRIVSIDALRGMDMFFLCGGATVLRLLLEWIWGADLPNGVSHQFVHATFGGGFTCWDLVMPLFIFITGASLPFAFEKYEEKGGANWRIGATVRVLRRVALLFLLGMLVQGNLASANCERMSLFCNTLQAIAEGYLIAAVVLLFCKLRGQIIVCAACLVSYWALLRFMPYNGHAGGFFEPQNNLAIYIDRLLQGSWQDGTPYSWILTSLSFGALTLMGSISGTLIRKGASLKTAGLLAGVGVASLGAGWLLSFDTPLIKHIFTTSAVLWSGGWCFLLIAAFHLCFDCFGKWTARLAMPLQVVGCNALLAYLLTEIHGPNGRNLWWGVTNPLVYGLSNRAGDAAALVHAALSLLLLWLVLYFLYRNKAFLKV